MMEPAPLAVKAWRPMECQGIPLICKYIFKKFTFGCVWASVVVVLRLGCPEACRNVPRPGIELMSPAFGRQIINPWTIRDILMSVFLNLMFFSSALIFNSFSC